MRDCLHPSSLMPLAVPIAENRPEGERGPYPWQAPRHQSYSTWVDPMRGWSAFLWAILLLAGSCWLAASPAQAQVNQRSMFESITLTIGPRLSPDPTELRGVGGGTVPAPEVAGRSETTNGPCVGFVGTKPSHTLILTSFLNYLSLQVQAPEDTTLVIKGPGGTWCNDDFRGKNPGIAGQWLPGTYQIWIGSYSKTNLHPYILRLTQKR